MADCGPADVTENSGPAVGPHPHIGLQTVTWLIDGLELHRDSLGSEQVITPGQLNLMTVGDGVSRRRPRTRTYSPTRLPLRSEFILRNTIPISTSSRTTTGNASV